MNIKLIFFLLVCTFQTLAQGDGRSVLLYNAYLHIGTGEVLESALVGVRNGKITLVKNALA